MSSDKEAGGEEHSEIAPVQTHQRQRGRLEASTAPASDRTAVAFRPIRYQMATLSSQLCSHTGDATFLRVAPSVGKTLYNSTQCYRNFIIYALKYLYKLNILAPTISPVLTQSSAKRFICCCFPPFFFHHSAFRCFLFQTSALAFCGQDVSTHSMSELCVCPGMSPELQSAHQPVSAAGVVSASHVSLCATQTVDGYSHTK